jgi:V8-like Glu-specific endopeptidase
MDGRSGTTRDMDTLRDRILRMIGAVMCASGCNSGSGPVTLPHFSDITTASPAIQVAARAVVRVHTAGEYATGSFISATGLLLTNNHVLGVPVCPVEGCTVQITTMHQRGTPYQAPFAVFAVPVAVDEGLDMAVVQIYSASVAGAGASAAKLETPDFLQWSPSDAASLIGRHITIVGHPEAKLKKWTDGVVTDAFGTWFSSTAYILPGDSGSPVLDDAGQLVGLIHHGSVSQDLVTNDGVDEESEGTASTPLQMAMSAPLPPTMISLAATSTSSAVVTNDRVYQNGGQSTAMVSDPSTGAASDTGPGGAAANGAAGAASDILALLGSACDKALADMTLQTIDDLSSALLPCYEAENWIECRSDPSSTPVYKTVCPSSADVTAWTSRYQAVSQRSVAMNGSLDMYALSFATAALATTRMQGVAQGGASLQQGAVAVDHVLDFLLANYFAAFDIASYQGNSVLDFVRGYAAVPEFQLYAGNIEGAVTWFGSNGPMLWSEVQSILAQLAADPNVTVGSKLAIEEFQYNSGWIQ